MRKDFAGYLTPLSFALVPVAGMILASRDVLKPTGESVLRISTILAAGLLLLYLALRRFLSTETASNSLGLPLLLMALYPGANTVAGATPGVDVHVFAWIYLVFCMLLAVVPSRLPSMHARSLRHVLTIIAILFLAFSAYVLGSSYGFTPRFSPQAARAIDRISTSLPAPRLASRKPDVLHFVVDGLGRPDVLSAEYGIQLGDAIGQFRALGFQVDPAMGHANYVQTHLSIPSMLNASYLDELTQVQGPTNDRAPLRALIRRARVPKLFKALGYRVSMVGALYATPFDQVDECSCDEPWFYEPEMGTMSLTPLKVLLPLGVGHRSYYRRSLGIFDEFEREGGDAEPRYVYGHVMLPHPPFVVDAEGGFVNPHRSFSVSDASFFSGTPEEYRAGYRAQTMFVLKRTLLMASRIVENAQRRGREVVVIIHGDHGPRLEFDARRPSPASGQSTLPIFLAIRWPQGVRPMYPPSSLVNVYRVVLSTLFGMDLPQLPDRAFLSGFTTPYVLLPVDVPESPASMTAAGGDGP
jgi:hypothetical protein